MSFRSESETQAHILDELTELGIDSIHIGPGVSRQEIHALAEFLWQLRDTPSSTGAIDAQLADAASGTSASAVWFRSTPAGTRRMWPDAPVGPIDPDYAESLALTERTFDDVAGGKGMNVVTVRDIVQLLIQKVAGSSAALGQILSVKLYENLTYCHSVNVATLSLLIGRQLGFDDAATAALGEAALLHDIGKTRIPIEVLKKPGALDRRERRTMEAHTTLGAEILVEVEGLRPLTPTVALEHHRAADGTGGYPDLGDRIAPHFLSQIVSVADIYEAITGARSYQQPAPPEQACLVLARLAGTKLNTALVKAFVNAISFFPIGSVVRTNREETGIVIRVNQGEPLHPVIAMLTPRYDRLPGEVDTSERDQSGEYCRHVVETLLPTMPLDLNSLLAPA